MKTLSLPGVYAAGGINPDMRDLARDGLLLWHWERGMDTRDIASALRMRESWVANRPAWLRDQSINHGEP